MCTTCAGSDRERKGGWDTLLDSKLSVYGHGIVDPHIRGAYKAGCDNLGAPEKRGYSFTYGN